MAHRPPAAAGHRRRVAQMHHQDTARAHARARFPAITCALQLIAGIPAWTARVVTGIEPMAAPMGGSLDA